MKYINTFTIGYVFNMINVYKQVSQSGIKKVKSKHEIRRKENGKETSSIDGLRWLQIK